MFLLSSSLLTTAEATEINIYNSPSCGCCYGWSAHMENNGYTVTSHNQHNMQPIKNVLGIPTEVQSCHTAKIGGYIIEGHVPASDIKRLLVERPEIRGLAVPGMPMGSPGMEGSRKDAYNVVTIEKNGESRIYASH
ncbi:hypothetical protein BOW53_01185 [Solemya pervernicosa gill symbiont]|uniref:CopG family transcriptional regulator n=2 Tax=Gammaproteobacteria incertae sedis TaxID=118884 RepID=A0A1T2LAW2_9GAMM|nr:DUF411 domain-containing protein [Candidatus Reidiella endopervernicosa]OOZ42243.1 hypothetical protein BOW53_01185 [Solemya pervernicosa gill symbiont]QKQ27213.1 DUF411 domain-containing protein [Candidatus Reidiella endopervernicosa]